MNDYQTFLMLEVLCATYSTQELVRGKEIKKILRRYFQLSAQAANCLIEGALVLRDMRERSGRTVGGTNLYVH